ncbi:PIN domain nuclease of toxin-antitoxin system [Rhizobium sp. PP-F2F-G38]|uniref:Type II toxin-antitoxin system VapC family toxin n=1 Tax=Ferranicluibacter rubi TaxID=2715133 RepID=A0AA43ZEI1_9HYPH|nr:type II toxin-antitoxin system VapC family toxin [Ferranicluibacter rubi]PYE37587.1 PIN domain nuclease of toxin-antitoxin system [Rhizobium sp. PP-WC-1G-195]PYF01054.1 PIN domain nuclease of toxin-antitoxin system [Rhizobium sp. PP-F2F-G38]TCQ10278.1 PIN domain nuclease of toxin-antitoxin system [Rhizobium sp. PP-F2F-G36]
MRHLLDTQIFISILRQQTSALPDDIRQCLDGHANYISTATLWEMAIKFRLGKLEFGDSLENLPKSIAGAGMTILPINEHHALHTISPEPSTRDPFDRLLLAQCAIENMRLVTIDRALADHPLSATAAP